MSNNKKKVSARMKVILSISAAGVGTLVYHGLANAVVNRDFGTTGTAGATILRPMTTTETTPLNFGQIVPAITSGIVTINANGIVSSETNQLIADTNAAAGVFLIEGGNASHAVTVSVDPTVRIENQTDSTKTMTINLNSPDAPTQLGGNGTDNF